MDCGWAPSTRLHVASNETALSRWIANAVGDQALPWFLSSPTMTQPRLADARAIVFSNSFHSRGDGGIESFDNPTLRVVLTMPRGFGLAQVVPKWSMTIVRSVLFVIGVDGQIGSRHGASTAFREVWRSRSYIMWELVGSLEGSDSRQHLEADKAEVHRREPATRTEISRCR